MKYLNKQDGQGLVEYAMILAFVAIILIALITLLGPQVSNMYERVIVCPGPFCPN